MFDLNDIYINRVGVHHRQALGQYFTPPEVATFMCRWALEGNATDLFDPAVGLGAFYFSARSLNPQISFSGAEIDSTVLDFLRQHVPETGTLFIDCQDYLLRWEQSHHGIVCNPPYRRFQFWSNRDLVFFSFQKHLSLRLSGYTNIASAFLLKSLSELSPAGRLAYLMPLEFLNTGYGTVVKRQLIESGSLKALIRLDAEKEVFPDATTSVGIILVNKDGRKDPVKFFTVQRLSDLAGIIVGEPKRSVPLAELNPADKWLKYFEDWQPSFSSSDLIGITYYGGFSRGIATGANEFFTMSSSRAKQLGLPRSALIGCVVKSAQIRPSIFTNGDWEALERADASVLLLNVNVAQNEAVAKYIRYGELNGYHNRYLTRARYPWYKLERRSPAPLLFGVFSREKFKVIRNFSDALNLTCYHGFYPNLFGQEFIDELFLYFQSRVARQILRISWRQYGDGLNKFEPNDLNNSLAPSPDWLSRLPKSLVNQAMDWCRVNGSLPQEIEVIFDTLLNDTEKASSEPVIQTGLRA